MNLLEVTDLEKRFSSAKGTEKKVFQHLNLQLKKGEFLTILGPSGCGKSTLLRVLAGLEKQNSGQISWKESKDTASFVFQDPRLIPWKTLSENILLAKDLNAAEISVTDLSQVLQLTKLAGSDELYPDELSGGMKMRASLARALVTSPTILWMDEPFSALDEHTRNQLQEDLNNIYVTNKSSVMFVTHSISEAVFLSQRILIMNSQGKIQKNIEINLPAKRDSQLRKSENFIRLVMDVTEQFQQVVVS